MLMVKPPYWCRRLLVGSATRRQSSSSRRSIRLRASSRPRADIAADVPEGRRRRYP
jgi:hypothetical protein